MHKDKNFKRIKKYIRQIRRKRKLALIANLKKAKTKCINEDREGNI